MKSPKRSGRPHRQPSPKPDGASVRNFTVLDKKRTPGDNVRCLITAIKALLGLPNRKSTSTERCRRLGELVNIPKNNIKEARRKLKLLFNNPDIKKEIEDGKLLPMRVLGMILDWAQHVVGLKKVPLASEYCLERIGRSGFIHFERLHELGLHPKCWELPLTADGMKAAEKSAGASPPALAARAVEPAGKGERSIAAATSTLPRQRKARITAEEEATVVQEQKPVGGAAMRRRKSTISPRIEPEKAAPMADIVRYPRRQGRPSVPLVEPESDVSWDDSSSSSSDEDYLGPDRNDEPTAKRRKTESPNPEIPIAHKDCVWLNRSGVEAQNYKVTGNKRELIRQANQDKEFTSCHDCQGYHVKQSCTKCFKSYCMPCCRHYEYLSDNPEDCNWQRGLWARFCSGECPHCLSICAVRRCLKRENDASPPKLSKEEKEMMAIHLVACLAKPASELLTTGTQEAHRQGKAMDQLEVTDFTGGYRFLCNRCATTLENVHVHCPICECDICPACCAELFQDDVAHSVPACPMCRAPQTTLNRLLSTTKFNKLRSAQIVLNAVQSRGGDVCNEYDFERRLWRLPGHANVDRHDAQQLSLTSWHTSLPPEDYRLASRRPGGVQDYIWTPHVKDFARNSPRRPETVKRFVQRWAAGEPIIIRGFRGRMNWGPEIVMRAARGQKSTEPGGHLRSFENLDVIDCNDWNTVSLTAREFFKYYQQSDGDSDGSDGERMTMYKLKDFPQEDVFSAKCQRHNQDFLEMLNSCMPEYMHPKGFLNLAGTLPEAAVPPDLGPKGYIAFGREEEHEIEGDSVTRLHEDLSDAINILCHVQQRPNATPAVPRCGDTWHNGNFKGNGAGAVWDLFRREDLPTLRQFLLDAVEGKLHRFGCPSFYYKGKKLEKQDVVHVVHDQAFMLTAKHRQVLAERYGVHPWLIEQYEWEGVVIPAGCAHQVRNLRACIKIALDFVSPESVNECLGLKEQVRQLAMKEVPVPRPDEDVAQRHFHDKLQVANMIFHGLQRSLSVLNKADGK